MKPSLADLRPGQTAKITSVECNRRMARRLLEMGLLPGTQVRIVRIAPLGDPLEVRLRAYSLSLRRSEASLIGVSPEEPS